MSRSNRVRRAIEESSFHDSSNDEWSLSSGSKDANAHKGALDRHLSNTRKSLSTDFSVGGDSFSAGDSTSSRRHKRRSTATGQKLAQAETRAVFRLRILVLLILFVAAAAVSAFVYIIAYNSEDDQFKAQFQGSATIVLERFENILKEHLSAISTVSVATLAHALDNGQEWPFVSLSYAQQRMAKINRIAGTQFLALHPLIDTLEEKRAWDDYTHNEEARAWISEGLQYQEQLDLNKLDEKTADDPLNTDLVGTYNMSMPDGSVMRDDVPAPYLPVWQTSPVLRQGLVNANRNADPTFSKWANLSMTHEQMFLSGMIRAPPGYSDDDDEGTQFLATILSFDRQERTEYLGDPITDVFIPVFDTFDSDRQPVAILQAVLHWKSFFRKILPPNIPDMHVVLDNSCEGSFTYIMMGHLIEPFAEGDAHDRAYDKMGETTNFDGYENIGDGTVSGLTLNQTECQYSMRVYPTDDYFTTFHTSTPLIMTIAVAAIFIFATCMFFLYDRLVERRQSLVMKSANQSDAIVASLFPRNIRERLMQQDSPQDDAAAKENFMGPQHRLQKFLGAVEFGGTAHTIANGGGNNGNDTITHGGAIADLFPNCTVMFADIVGFTAWSSARDPTQVFDLLQTIYQSFDLIAKRRKVFKVETIGDCYLAVTGLPEPQPHHAMIMSKFAAECSLKLMEITKTLEVTLGPDTGDLGMRFGLHSGPVTAGVLRGERSRFQLFGDTVNTAARMESTGMRDRIQVSQATANLITAAGKEHWLTPRKDPVTAKGKGVLYTFWLYPHHKKAGSDSKKNNVDDASRGKLSSTGGSSHGDSEEGGNTDETGQSSGESETLGAPLVGLNASSAEKYQSLIPMAVRDEDFLAKEGRRIDWISRLLEENIKRVIARREAYQQVGGSGTFYFRRENLSSAFKKDQENRIPLDEVEDKITLNNLNMKVTMKEVHYSKIKLDPDVKAQLREYVSDIAAMYHRNPFHNFEHACHVTMSVVKLLKRIVTPDLDVENLKTSDLVSQLHDYTYGITSDPMATLAIIFSALIHDVDHRGVGNAQLSKEEPDMAEHYQQKSIAEQNSLDIAWDILMRHKYRNLRTCIFKNAEDFEHFRQVAVNVVLATDIFDKELNAARKGRWNRAFSKEDAPGTISGDANVNATPNQKTGSNMEDIDLRATIVIEHIIQASDVAHTMQHWHIYQRWNERLFREMTAAFKSGRMGSDPANFWYKGEIGFFDNYIIPLAKKLKECGVFGVSSDEYLNYATLNRDEWKEKGEEIVKQFVERLKEESDEEENGGVIT